MTKPDIKIIFFDIDETLYVKNKAILPTSVPSVIRSLKHKGIIPAIATGRARCAFPEKIDQLIKQEGIELFVTINGQYNSYKNQVISKHPIATTEIERIIHFLQIHQIDYAFVGNEAIAVSNITPQLKKALDPITTRYFIDQDYYKTHDIYQLLLFYPESQDQFIANSGILGEQFKTVRWHDYSVDCLVASGSKASGIDAVVNHFGLTIDNVMAFGDGLNDIEMITHVGTGVAMGNAHPELKKIADYVTEDIEHDGVLKGLLALGVLNEKDLI
ncbi:Cof-type HAD-IIB family hydrolase [Gallibacterium anatis]|uniref:Cof-type HAD-IIB family hydrolase n=1 Tax=Gallibacterium anatis TaxID=750 RepID=UPI00222E8158|nr:Cof-type HAD-IIB family hydrolase [Gallibacterium anatis]UZD15629.1 Cof-type HAD-IIB family hydrolase [Gallibacterium anatis]